MCFSLYFHIHIYICLLFFQKKAVFVSLLPCRCAIVIYLHLIEYESTIARQLIFLIAVLDASHSFGFWLDPNYPVTESTFLCRFQAFLLDFTPVASFYLLLAYGIHLYRIVVLDISPKRERELRSRFENKMFLVHSLGAHERTMWRMWSSSNLSVFLSFSFLICICLWLYRLRWYYLGIPWIWPVIAMIVNLTKQYYGPTEQGLEFVLIPSPSVFFYMTVLFILFVFAISSLHRCWIIADAATWRSIEFSLSLVLIYAALIVMYVAIARKLSEHANRMKSSGEAFQESLLPKTFAPLNFFFSLPFCPSPSFRMHDVMNGFRSLSLLCSFHPISLHTFHSLNYWFLVWLNEIRGCRDPVSSDEIELSTCSSTSQESIDVPSQKIPRKTKLVLSQNDAQRIFYRSASILQWYLLIFFVCWVPLLIHSVLVSPIYGSNFVLYFSRERILLDSLRWDMYIFLFCFCLC